MSCVGLTCGGVPIKPSIYTHHKLSILSQTIKEHHTRTHTFTTALLYTKEVHIITIEAGVCLSHWSPKYVILQVNAQLPV